MPFVILGLLLVVAVILYLTFANNEGDPSLKVRPFSNMTRQEPQTDAEVSSSDEADKSEVSAEKAESSEVSSEATEPDKNVHTTDESSDKNAEPEKSFESMEELTEFYRREAEKLTGIKH